MTREISALTAEIDTLLNHFPDTIWPIPHLLRRAGRLLLRTSRAGLTEYNLAIEYIDTAHAAMREWNNEEPRPITLALLAEKLAAHCLAANLLKDTRKGWKWKNDPQIVAHLDQARETLDTAREDSRELFGTDGGLLVDRIAKLGRRFEKLDEEVGF